MTVSRRWRGELLALAASGLMAFAQPNIARAGECSTPSEDGRPACPDLLVLHMARNGLG